MPSHQRLHRGCSNAPERNKRDYRQQHPAASGETKAGKTDGAEKQAGKKTAPFTKVLHEGAYQNAGNDRGANTDKCEGVPNIAVAP